MTDSPAPAVENRGHLLAVRFAAPFNPPAYDLFLKVKRLPERHVEYDPDAGAWTVTAPARYAPLLGVPLPERPPTPLPLSPFLFDDQSAIVKLALDARRFADWKDTGLGKTLDFLEWSRHVSHEAGRVLIVTLNNLVNQTCEEAERFYGDSLPLVRLPNKASMREWCETGKVCGLDTGAKVGIVNYEKFNPEGTGKEGSTIQEVRHLGGIVLDESSRLAMGGGKQKWAIIHSSKGVPYKLSCTATPAPNDTMEFASQASFLERMRSEGEIIWTYFTRHPKTHRWAVKKHARQAFFEFMASWSIYVRDPRRYGWRLGMEDVPAPEIFRHELKATPEQLKLAVELTAEASGQLHLFAGDRDTNTIERAKLSQIAKGFRYVTTGKTRRAEPVPSAKPAFVAELVRQEVAAGHQVLLWTVFDAESEILAAELRRVGVTSFDLLTGKTPDGRRVEYLEAFRKGRSRVLASRASMLGFGMNFQFCTSMVFSGWSDSYVQWYQSIRRAYRYGQKRSLRVHVPVIPELEGAQLDNLDTKECRQAEDIREMEACYVRAMRATGLLPAQAAGLA